MGERFAFRASVMANASIRKPSFEATPFAGQG